MNHFKLGLITLASATVLAACGTTTVTPPPPPPPPPPAVTGTLALNITGPSGVIGFAPNVVVTATGFNQTVSNLGNQNLTVPVGNATVTVNKVTQTGTIVDKVFAGYVNVAGKPASTTSSIAQGATTTVPVRYDGAGYSGEAWLTKGGTNFFGYNDALLAGSGGAIAATNTLGAGTQFTGMAFDRAGNLWVADGPTSGAVNQIKEYDSTFTLVQTITSNAGSLFIPRGLAFDSNGDLWVANLDGAAFLDGLGKLVKFSGTSLAAGSGTNSLATIARISTVNARYEQIAFDATGNLWAVDLNNKVYKFDAAGLTTNPAPSVTLSGVTSPYGLAFDSAGKLWIADSAGVKKFDPPVANSSPTPTLTLNRTGNFTTASAMAFDKLNNLWVLDSAGVYEFTAATIAGSSGVTSLPPAKTFDVGGFARDIVFFPIPANVPIFK